MEAQPFYVHGLTIASLVLRPSQMAMPSPKCGLQPRKAAVRLALPALPMKRPGGMCVIGYSVLLDALLALLRLNL